jgi:hypothetical protein
MQSNLFANETDSLYQRELEFSGKLSNDLGLDILFAPFSTPSSVRDEDRTIPAGDRPTS